MQGRCRKVNTLGWPESLFGFFRKKLQKKLNELSGQPYIYKRCWGWGGVQVGEIEKETRICLWGEERMECSWQDMVKFNARLEGHIICRWPMPELHEGARLSPDRWKSLGSNWDGGFCNGQRTSESSPQLDLLNGWLPSSAPPAGVHWDLHGKVCLKRKYEVYQCFV